MQLNQTWDVGKTCRPGKTILYVGKKVTAFICSIWFLSLAVFCLSRLAPANPLQSYYGERAEKMSAGEQARAREKLGLDAPLHIQYLRWMEHALHGDFGISYKYKQDVKTVIGHRIKNTLLLGGIGYLLTFSGALALGILCAFFEDRFLDRLLCRFGTFASCIPEFWVSLALIFVFCVTLHWLPSSGAYSAGGADDVAGRIVHLILPMAAVLGAHLWYYAYMVRNRLSEEAKAEYVLLGKSCGLTKTQVLLRHCLRNIMPSYISMMAVSVPHVLGGTYIVETVFSYPGLGTLCFESARYADYNLLMVLCMMTGTVVILCNAVGQAVNEKIDPRIRHLENH